MRMSHASLVVALTAFLAPAAAGTAAAQAPKSTGKPVAAKKAPATPPGHGTVVAQAHATLAGQGITGAADFTERKNGTVSWVEIHLTAKGLKPGLPRRAPARDRQV